jgi:hypothetical protein
MDGSDERQVTGRSKQSVGCQQEERAAVVVARAFVQGGLGGFGSLASKQKAKTEPKNLDQDLEQKVVQKQSGRLGERTSIIDTVLLYVVEYCIDGSDGF